MSLVWVTRRYRDQMLTVGSIVIRVDSLDRQVAVVMLWATV